MDVLADLLTGVHAHAAAFCQTTLEPPWALRIADGAPLALATPQQGQAWIVPEAADPVLLHTGDVAIVKGPQAYTVADAADTPPSITVHAGNRLTADGVDVTADFKLSPHTSALGPRHGATPTGRTTILASGTYQVVGDVSGRLLAALPTIVVVPRAAVQSPIMDLLAAEVVRDEPGQQIILDRLLDLALIATLRGWFAGPSADIPGWYRAQADDLAGPALRAIHQQPERAWTVASLAGTAGASRTVFAERFQSLVGQSPIAYLTTYRIDRAADLLRSTDATIEAIAHRVGYANAYALSTAFKRERGITPRRHRAAAA